MGTPSIPTSYIPTSCIPTARQPYLIISILRTELINLVEHQYRVERACTPKRLHDQPRHRTDVSPSMACRNVGKQSCRKAVM